MDLLLEKYNDYARLIGCRAVYELENGLSIEYTYRKDNFVHLIGLHKLDDILLINRQKISNVLLLTCIYNPILYIHKRIFDLKRN